MALQMLGGLNSKVENGKLFMINRNQNQHELSADNIKLR